MKLTCNCDAPDLRKVKARENINFHHSKKAGFFDAPRSPETWVCANCSQVVFSIKDSDKKWLLDLE